jgi:uncharacterized integral membrane protein
MSAGQYTPGPEGQPEQSGNGMPPADRTGTAAAPNTRPADASPASPSPTRTPTTQAPTPTAPAPAAADQPRVTRAGVVWAAVVAALVVLILLIIFILQNQDQVVVRYLGLEGMVPLGMALFIASVTGGVLVAMAGGARILQLRRNAHRARVQQRR